MVTKNMDRFRGIISSIITPFDENGNIVDDYVRKEVRVLLDAGVQGISPGGSTGEGAMLTDEELVHLIHIVKEENTKNLPIVAGVIRNSTQAAVKAGLAAKEAGADMLMVTPTAYAVLTPDDDGNYAYYKAISDAVGLPIIIYNVVPSNVIDTDLFERLLEIENVVGMKQSCGGIKGLYDMKIRLGNKALLYSATDDMLFSCFELGADGAIAAVLPIFPKECVQMWEYAQAGETKKGLEIQTRLFPLWQIVTGNGFTERVKECIRQLGRTPGYSRSPLHDCSAETKEAIRLELERIQAASSQS